MNTQTPPLSPYLSKLISAISNFDTQALDDLLYEEYLYSGASKFIILSKFKELFDQFNKNGDAILEMYSGFCAGSCECNGQQGFIFIGNKSRDYFTLLFKELDAEYFDFTTCYNLKTKDASLLLNEQRDLTVYDNEKSNFYAHPRLKEKMKLAEIAILEIQDFPPVVDHQFYHVWVDCYQPLRNQITLGDYRYSFLVEFEDLFDPLLELSKTFKMVPLCQTANLEFHSLNIQDEKSIADWLEKYEDQGMDLLEFFYLDEDEGFLTPDNLIRLNENLSVVNEYTEVHAFKLNFYEHYVFPEIPNQESLEMGGHETEEDGGESWYNV